MSRSGEIGRRTFVDLSTGAVALGGGITAALAQATEFGSPHPPLVPEDDPSLEAALAALEYEAADGTRRALNVYYAEPKGVTKTAPAIVVVQAVWGVDAQLRDTVRRLAKAGYVAVAPDLYTGLGAPSGDGRSDIAPFRAVSARLSDDVVDADIAATARHIRKAGGAADRTVGVVGFCMGGGIALRQTIRNAGSFAAASVFYGKFAIADADAIGVPLAGSWGARDTSIAAAGVAALDARLTQLGKPHDIKIYGDAGHAFFDDTRASYVASAASDAWARTLASFARYLK